MKYTMFAKSIQGPKYAKKEWVCQDYSDSWEADNAQVIAIADGHGSPDCFRSEYGAMAAILTAHFQSWKFCKTAADLKDPFLIFSKASIDSLKYSIWQEWRKLVKGGFKDRLKKHEIFGEGELRYESVSEKYKARYTSEDPSVVSKYLYTAYGTTLLLAISFESHILVLQIGDGTCVVLQRNGEFKTPMPPDEDNFLNVTTSLCDEYANLEIRDFVLSFDHEDPNAAIALFLSSDGVDDCYPVYNNEQHLYRLYTVILDNILQEGYDETKAEIADKLLLGMTKKGSQDDISLAFFVCDDIAILREAYENINAELKPITAVNSEPKKNSEQNNNDSVSDSGDDSNTIVTTE